MTHAYKQTLGVAIPKTKSSVALESYISTIERDGMSRDLFNTIRSSHAEFLPELSSNHFSTIPSRTKQQVALEDLKKIAMIAGAVVGAVALGTMLWKLYKWIKGKSDDTPSVSDCETLEQEAESVASDLKDSKTEVPTEDALQSKADTLTKDVKDQKLADAIKEASGDLGNSGKIILSKHGAKFLPEGSDYKRAVKDIATLAKASTLTAAEWASLLKNGVSGEVGEFAQYGLNDLKILLSASSRLNQADIDIVKLASLLKSDPLDESNIKVTTWAVLKSVKSLEEGLDKASIVNSTPDSSTLKKAGMLLKNTFKRATMFNKGEHTTPLADELKKNAKLKEYLFKDDASYLKQTLIATKDLAKLVASLKFTRNDLKEDDFKVAEDAELAKETVNLIKKSLTAYSAIYSIYADMVKVSYRLIDERNKMLRDVIRLNGDFK